MPVKIINREYSELYSNDTTNWLLGNVGDWQQLTLRCEVSVEYYGTQENSVFIDPFLKTFKLNSGKNWRDLGFDIGQTAKYQFHFKSDFFDTTLVTTFTILSVNGDTMEVSNMAFDSTPAGWDTINYGTLSNESHPLYRGNITINEVILWADVEPEGVKFSYTHTTNDEIDNNSVKSLIDGSTTSLIKPNVILQPVNSYQNMTPVGQQSGMSIRFGEVRKLGKKVGSRNTYQYDIRIQFLLSSFFENIDDVLDKKKPSFLEGENSFTDNFKVIFLPKWNNPNASISNEMGRSERLGNTGWFNENFNELPDRFKVDYVQYFDENGNLTQGLDYFSKTKVKVQISNVQNLNTNTKCGFGFIWLPKNEEDYKNKETPFYRNTFVSTGSLSSSYNVGQFYPTLEYGGGLNNASMNTRNVRFSDIGGGKIVFEVLYEPTSEFSVLFDSKNENDRNYALWVSVSDQTLQRNFSDRVSLLVDVNQMRKTPRLLGEYEDISVRYIEHPYSETNTGVAIYNGFLQDDILCKIPFKIDLSKDKFIKMRFGIELFKPSTAKQIVLEKFDVDFSQFYVGINGEPMANINMSRGFKLNNGNNKNWLKLNRNNSLDTGSSYGYLAYYSFKIRYEDWQKNDSLPSDFFKTSELNDGINNDWLHLISVLGWQLNFFTEIDSDVNGQLGKYVNRYKFKINDYDSNNKITTNHYYYRDSDNTLLNIGNDPTYNKPLGVIISNEPTRIEVEFEIVDGIGVWDVVNYYGVTTIEIDKGAGITQMRQLSSVWEREADNPLIPTTGETKLKLEVDVTGKKIKTICLVDPALLDAGSKYRITSRIGCKNIGVVDSGKYEYRYENRYE